MVEKRRVQQSEVQPWQSYVESSREKQTDGRDMQSQVEVVTAMVELRRVKQIEVEPWQSYV